jgi:Tfp pilus assembly protein PilN
MNRLGLDFVHRARSPWPGRLLLAVALAVSLDVALSYKSLSGAVALSEARLSRAQPRSAPARKVSAEELAAVRETVDRLATPWDRLFAALESAASDQVALLGIQPDPKGGTVVISGDSKDYLAALSYVLNLSRTEALDRVQLVRHEVKANDPQSPVAFAVSAGWSQAKP